MANGHGGKRNGAGRKKAAINDYQAKMRAIVADTVRPKDWETVILTSLAQAQAGDKSAREWLADWVMGKVPDEINVNAKAKVTLKWSDDDSDDS